LWLQEAAVVVRVTEAVVAVAALEQEPVFLFPVRTQSQ
jgi:hypothetical protein